MIIKKYFFNFFTLQRNNFFGRGLISISRAIRNSLENKMNDNELSGEYRVLRKLAALNPKIVFDVGANVGNWTKEFKTHSPDSLVYSFEPIPQTFEKLSQNLKNLPKVTLHQMALSDKTGSIDFNFYPSNSYFSSIYQTNLDPNFLTISVDTISGDEFCDRNDISEIDLLKIDVEGAENKVLAGFSKRLNEQKIKVIQFEYGPYNIDSHFLLKDFFKLLEGNGYRVGKIYPKWIDTTGYSIEKENFILSNFLAVSIKENLIFDYLIHG